MSAGDSLEREMARRLVESEFALAHARIEEEREAANRRSLIGRGSRLLRALLSRMSPFRRGRHD